MYVNVDGQQYIIAGFHTGVVSTITHIRYATYIDDELVYLDDVSGVKTSGPDALPIYTKDEKVDLLQELKDRLSNNIRKIINSRL